MIIDGVVAGFTGQELPLDAGSGNSSLTKISEYSNALQASPFCDGSMPLTGKRMWDEPDEAAGLSPGGKVGT